MLSSNFTPIRVVTYPKLGVEVATFPSDPMLKDYIANELDIPQSNSYQDVLNGTHFKVTGFNTYVKVSPDDYPEVPRSNY